MITGMHPMRHFTFLTSITILLLLSPLVAKATEQQLLNKLDAFLYGASINDASVHNTFWHEDLVYTSSGGTRFGKAELMKGVRETGPIVKTEVTTWFSSQDVKVRLYDHLAIVNFKLVAKTDESEKYYLNSGTFVRKNEQWQAVNWQATKAAD
ncbi:hypothetical protein GCM10011357_28350 [Lacimicrobium alkaliphilum]|uniref:DUF4440 domain-containing protein n=2 Tax=Lacimicrobium alkaliphilum TaxID=1526571 RepID=A0ABQ1RL81_9ALTE|nr:hypothetical protein GCM10011357_28350 [Lacimicrobium alkaliphilum]